ncbi:hypothetical protein [Halalkalibacter alkalisediminis]|uniref:Uncharacterized protein n=1 Tax=Halalkalibacter alkalisediminis TaxID=935616 RepID=A0ABV6NFG3_9BACI|nr:hypothetical protein [Halalkalibacter alkalisediminis]
MSNQQFFYKGPISRSKQIDTIITDIENMKHLNEQTVVDTKKAIDELLEDANKTIREATNDVIYELKLHLEKKVQEIVNDVATKAEKSVNKTARKAARRAAKRAARKASNKAIQHAQSLSNIQEL